MTEADFRARIAAVSYYLRSLRELESRHKKPGSGFYRAAATLAASRASAFIMIYNCVEFAARETVVGVRKHMQANNARFSEINDFWQIDVIQAHFKSKLEDGMNHNNLMREFREFIPGKLTWLKRHTTIPFTGNVDHERLIKLAKDIGVKRWKPPSRTLGGSDLFTVRQTRNQLAHGEETFETIGASYSVKDIADKLERIRLFMCSYIRSMERYTANTDYKLN